MTNIAAAIGLAQLERAADHLQVRRRIAAAYDERLGSLSNRIYLPKTEPWAEHVYWMYTIMLRDDVSVDRDTVMRRLDQHGIETRPVFYPMHVLPPYAQDGTSFPNAEFSASHGINLPTHGRLTNSDLDRVAAALQLAVS
jgi:perosamine synthetase